MAPTLNEKLTGRDFIATSAIGMSLLDDVPITIGFRGEELHAHAGCNRIFGPITLSGATLRAGTLASTMMACPDPIAAQERALLQLLSSRPAVTLAGDSLTLTAGDGKIRIESIQRHPSPLIGTRWGLTGLVKDHGLHPPGEGTEATIRFTDDEVAVDFGCNTGGGAITVTAGTIDFGPLRITRMLCPPPVMEVEHHMSQVLDGTVGYEIDGEELRLTNAELGLRLRAS